MDLLQCFILLELPVIPHTASSYPVVQERNLLSLVASGRMYGVLFLDKPPFLVALPFHFFNQGAVAGFSTAASLPYFVQGPSALSHSCGWG